MSPVDAARSRHSRRFLAPAAALLALILGATALSACTSQKDAGDDGRPLVLTTFTVIADMAENVGGGHLRIESITKPGDEIHGFEPSPQDIRHASEAALILDNGLGLERWFERFMQDSGAKHVTLSDGVEPIDIRVGPYSGRPNPHAWMSPTSGARYVHNIAVAFAELDPAHAEEYRENAREYSERILRVGDGLRTTVAKLPKNHRTLVTCEGAFSYLTRDVGLDELYLWPVNADSEGTPQQIRTVVEQVRARNIPAVFCESTVPDAAMKQVASETGSAFGGVLHVDSLSPADGDAPDYLSLLSRDIDVIAKGLTRQ